MHNFRKFRRFAGNWHKNHQNRRKIQNFMTFLKFSIFDILVYTFESVKNNSRRPGDVSRDSRMSQSIGRKTVHEQRFTAVIPDDAPAFDPARSAGHFI